MHLIVLLQTFSKDHRRDEQGDGQQQQNGDHKHHRLDIPHRFVESQFQVLEKRRKKVRGVSLTETNSSSVSHLVTIENLILIKHGQNNIIDHRDRDNDAEDNQGVLRTLKSRKISQ